MARTLAVVALLALAASASVSARSLRQAEAAPKMLDTDTTGTITLPSVDEVKAFIDSPEVRSFREVLASAPALPPVAAPKLFAALANGPPEGPPAKPAGRAPPRGAAPHGGARPSGHVPPAETAVASFAAAAAPPARAATARTG